jgi:hypothetical protein
MIANRIPLPSFIDIFPDYETFKNWYTSIPLSDNLTDCPNEKTFTLIFYEYNSWTCAFNETNFKQKFANILYSTYREFEETTREIISLMSLTDEDIALDANQTINMANIPETPNTTNIEEVDFVTTQQKTINRKGVLQIRREQLSNKRVFTVKSFLNRFKPLFSRIVSDPYLSLVKEGDIF